MLVELVGGLAVLLAVVLGAGNLLAEEWRRARCAWSVFEEVHGARLGRRAVSVRRPEQLQITRQGTGIRGEASCSSAREEVFLPWLDGQPEEPARSS